MTEDPYAILGVDPGATEEELRAARRRLARDVHPDHAGGSAAATAAMQRLNLAFDAAMTRLTAPPATTSGGAGGAGGPPRGTGAAGEATAPRAEPPGAPGSGPVPRPGGRLAHDVASFTIEALPVEAFEALVVVASWIGEVLDDDPPYRLDTWLGEPYDCWCRLDLVPDAGASTVALTLGTIDGRAAPDLDTVRDTWVAELNTLGRADDAF